jgi:hypothetical protein
VTRVGAARLLWIALAVAVWNVIFDHVIVVAGRAYIYAAYSAARDPSVPYARMDEWMRPAVTRAFWTASLAAVLILATGLSLIRVARRGETERPKDV